ncbi:protein JTB isoform X2 [Melopsittacus undulatus]|uniref:protein JTB isoform X2 n=1 Tax=Melopsittacus undulatus TaxID=13146 RepID=UPI00146A05D1|nr:protein JTB isoform X2 [Melopsittacus undulatus]
MGHVICAGLALLLCGISPAAAMAAGDERRSASPVSAACWRVEEFVVAQECSACTGFQMTVPECSPTGFVEQINCAGSKRAEFKSCRSALQDSRSFWHFVGSSLALAAGASILVLWRQRLLDRKALEKVRKQMESI